MLQCKVALGNSWDVGQGLEGGLSEEKLHCALEARANGAHIYA